jgi:hypothetical protein
VQDDNPPEVVPGQDLKRDSEATAQTGDVNAPTSDGQPALLCGLRKRTFWIMTAIITFGTLAIIGGILGWHFSANKLKSFDNRARLMVLDNSSIAAVNYTDGNGGEYRMMFWQAKTGDLMFSVWSWQNTTWLPPVSVQSRVNDNEAIPALLGTPLAAVTRQVTKPNAPFDYFLTISLFYLSRSMLIREVDTSDILGRHWDVGTGLNVEVGANSSLAAWWQPCHSLNCSLAIYPEVFWEDDKQNMLWQNGSEPSWGTMWLASPILQGSPLTVTGVTDSYGGPDLAMRAYFVSSGVISELEYTGSIYGWMNGMSQFCFTVT